MNADHAVLSPSATAPAPAPARVLPPRPAAGAGSPPRTARGGPVRLLLADDHPLIAAGVRAVVAEDPRLLLVGSAADRHGCERLTGLVDPEVVVLGLALPGALAADLVRRVRQRAPRAGVLVLTGHLGGAAAQAALRAGAAEVASKESQPSALLGAIHRVAAGSPAGVPGAVGTRGPRGRGVLDERLRRTGVTRREHDVIRQIAEGHTVAETASALVLSPHTVRSYLKSAMHKLQAHHRVDLLRKAERSGLL
ncbi:response regulator transcription factor [Streptomyces sp. F63]|uniref:LuxR C-terminal-related transcriptional regulator n=1 Tax=Streptomyces sp. F63 TaxID=2824887 RepID=UPI001B389AEA|nr:response regulator transcription factor [Streptomyces sp. F63]MBQ0985988.1 response regulator transcription factor [Streptomyces sp. F63]